MPCAGKLVGSIQNLARSEPDAFIMLVDEYLGELNYEGTLAALFEGLFLLFLTNYSSHCLVLCKAPSHFDDDQLGVYATDRQGIAGV